MTARQLREKARALAVKNYGRMTKERMIRAIQLAEGNVDCYKKIRGCGQMDCCWRDECQG